jgi:hypothetical protein
VANVESFFLSHTAKALVCTDEGIQGHTPVQGEGGGELKRIKGAKASSQPMLLDEPLGFAVMHIGHADDSKLSPGDVLKKSGPQEFKVRLGDGMGAHLSDKHRLECNDAQARDEARGLGAWNKVSTWAVPTSEW